MNQRYTRLKRKMLLLVVLGTVAAGALGIFLVHITLDGALQAPLFQGFSWVARHLFGQSEASALALYQRYISGNKQSIVTVGIMGLMLIAFYLAMGRFTRWLNQVGQATRQVGSDSGEAISLPKELAPVEADLKAIQAQLRAREAAARESEQKKNNLVLFLAHDLKTPLTSVVGYLTLLRDEPNLAPAERAKYTGIALDKAERLEELIREFFDITCLSLKNHPEEETAIQLSLLLEQLSDEFYPLFAEKELQCHTDIQPQLMVYGDPDRLARVFDNVLRNAVSYSTSGGTVDIWARTVPGDKLEIVIRNQGLEIPEGELAHIFETFYRLDAARSTRTGGAGLGLAIAKEIVELHGGTIRAERDGRKTSFVITLPAYKRH